MGVYNNPNLFYAAQSAFIDYSSSSEAVTLPVGTKAVTLRATTKCWIKIGQPGETATAVAPSAEKVWVERILPLNIDEEIDVAIPPTTDANLVQVAVIRATADGVLDIIARKE